MALTKKGKMKENLQFQTMYSPEAGTNIKNQVVGKINGMSADDPRIVEVLYLLDKTPDTIPLWLKAVVGLTGLGQGFLFLMGFIF